MEALEPKDDYCPVKTDVEEHCKSHCTKYYNEYEGCVKRIENLDTIDDKTLKVKCEYNGVATKDYTGKDVPREKLLELIKPKANCIGQYFEYFHCIDHCASPKLWSKLK
mmetsp:Transcript_455/g.589  ORF Transcript_455/g.589 Transcript_455/m.589 type:complete len:109 (+) Transcript_455:13-339(+)